jgi:hypothetical protein
MPATDYYTDTGRPPDEADRRSTLDPEPCFDPNDLKHDLISMLSTDRMRREVTRGLHGTRLFHETIREVYPMIVAEVFGRPKRCLGIDAQIHAIIKARLRRKAERQIRATIEQGSELSAGSGCFQDADGMVRGAAFRSAPAMCC